MEQVRDLLESKEKKSLVASGSQILCKMSWDGNHLDKDIPTPPNKLQVRKQEKHTPTHKAEPRSQTTEGRQLCTMQEEVELLRNLRTQNHLEPWGNAPHIVLGEGKSIGPVECEAIEDCLVKEEKEDRKWRNFHF